MVTPATLTLCQLAGRSVGALHASQRPCRQLLFGVEGLGFRVRGLGLRVWGLGFIGFGVWGLGFRVWGLGFRV